MKRIFTTWLLALLAGAASFAATMSDDGHVLTGLWKQYEEASKADLPKKEAEILLRIRTQAMERHLPVDFYDAASAYVRSVQRRDWKQRDQLHEELKEQVAAFADPMVTFLWMNNWDGASAKQLWAYVQAHPEGFQGCNRAFHRDVDGYLNGGLKPFIQTDKEYVLWYLLSHISSRDTEAQNLEAALRQEIDGRYPALPALEFRNIQQRYWPAEKRAQEKQAYEELAAQYAGTAFSVFPRTEVLRVRMSQLLEGKAGSQAFQALCADAQALEKERKAYKGDDATLVAGCRYPASLVDQLQAQDLDVNFDEGKVVVLFQNLQKATLTLRSDKKTIKTWQLSNPVGSFYVQDSVVVKLPKLDDGDYTVEAKNGQISDQDYYTQYTLSIATRTDSRGRCVYVADYESGVPLRSVTLFLMKNGKDVAFSSLKLDGFTPLPEALVKEIRGNRGDYQLRATSGSRKSRSVYIEELFSPSTYDDRLYCNIYKDRGAYNPGDTLQFKAIVYEGDPARELKVVAGRKVEMNLRDSENNIIESQKLTTNEWGAVSGSFVLPKGLRNGRFELEAVGLGYDWFRVDEFVLPTFDLSFDAMDKLYLVGDEVPVSGKLISYSGHSLSGASLSMTVQRYSTTVFQTDVPLGPENSFSSSFKAANSGYYNVEVLVTEATGETHSFSQGLYITDGLRLEASVPDAADAQMQLADDNNARFSWQRPARFLITSPQLRISLQARNSNGDAVPLPVQYQLNDKAGKELSSGEVPSGKLISLPLPGDGEYLLVATTQALKADENTVKTEQKIRIFCQQPGNRKLVSGIDRLFVAGPLTVAGGGNVTARLGSGDGDAWAVVTLYGQDRQVLVHKCLHVSKGYVDNIALPYLDSYPDAVRLQVFYFINGESENYNREYRREKDKYSLPLQFTRFQDKAYPGVEYSFSVKTDARAEVLVAAWDKSMDAIETNDWPLVNTRDFSVENVYISRSCGKVSDGEDGRYYGRNVMMSRGAVAKSADGMMLESAVAVEESAVMDDATPFQMVEQKPSFGALDDVQVRESFASALTFQPHLRPEADGTLHFSFRTSDKLSTYYVRVYAHDTAMHNAMVQQEMVVSLPVKVSLLEPRFLYAGDQYQAVVTVSSISDEAVSGLLMLVMGDTMQEVRVTVPAGGTVSQTFMVTCQSEEPSITLTAAFKAADFSDAVRVQVPVYPAAQTLTEAHSAVLRAGMDRETLLQELYSRFVNVPASAAKLQEISVLDMVRDAIPAHVDPTGNDVLSLSEAWYVRLMAARLADDEVSMEGNTPAAAKSRVDASAEVSPSSDDLLERVMACRNADGGFGWFEGMSSSPIITAVVLERMAKLRDRGFTVPDDLEKSVKYLDRNQFDDVLPVWRGWLSDAQYMHVRALYAQVPFEVQPVSDREKKRMKEFCKDAKSYLVPSKKDGRGMNGQILNKARRVLTLRNLLERDGGLALAKAWGVSLGAKSKLQASMKADIASLLEYAVEHRDGGWYYPNAVMPWRGLLETEAYAHALLCDLLTVAAGNNPVILSAPSVILSTPSVILSGSEGSNAAAIADGIRLWLMLQKETQKWDAEPAFIDAITSILDGSEAVLQTRVLALSATYEAPFADIKPAGNGFTIQRKFFRDGQELREGDPVQVGDVIEAQYLIWNAENRSFVKVTAGREAALTPSQQLSGPLGYRFIAPVRSGITWGFVPQGYRNVKAAVTEFFFDTYPEENTCLKEEFFVERAGRFQAPVLTIESLYAPHYRANDTWRQPLEATAR